VLGSNWVFRAVVYPIRYTLIIRMIRGYGKNKAIATFIDRDRV
jgi:hypothetical protein